LTVLSVSKTCFGRITAYQTWCSMLL